MQNPAYGFYVVARCKGEVVATLMVTTEWSDWRDGLFWWLQSVYVTPNFRRQGIYRQMYGFVKQKAQSNPDVCGYRLYVERENHAAQKTYKSMGMIDAGYDMYEELVG
jgi:GNAT superfamily N-acetyltransferase